jgi:hypothetical protein
MVYEYAGPVRPYALVNELFRYVAQQTTTYKIDSWRLLVMEGGVNLGSAAHLWRKEEGSRLGRLLSTHFIVKFSYPELEYAGLLLFLFATTL